MSNNKYIDIFGPVKKLSDVINEISSVDHFSIMHDNDQLPHYAASIAITMKDVTSTQMRRYYGYLKGIEQINRPFGDDCSNIVHKHKLRLLLPKIAGSSERTHLIDLYEVVKASVEKITTVGDVRAFVDFFEAILDFHSTIDNKKDDQ